MRLSRRLAWLVVGALTVVALAPVSAFAHDGLGTAPNANSIELIPWDDVKGPPSCSGDPFLQFRADPVADGTYGPNGEVTIVVHGDTFDWALTPFGISAVNISAVLVKGGPDTVVAYYYTDGS